MINSEPYRPFFIFGATVSLYAAGLWIPQIFQLSTSYPVLQHSFSMMSGFTLSFIFGFLMTAVPKFTGTFVATKTEINSLLALIMLSQFFGFINIKVSYSLTIVAMFFLIIFLYKRYKNKNSKLPIFFLFIPCYFLSSLIGLFLMLSANTFMIGKKILYYGSTDYLILGLGSILIPALLGTKPLPTDKDFKVVHYKTEIVILLFLALGLIGSNLLFVFNYTKFAYYSKLIINLIFAYRFWLLLKIPKNFKWFKLSLWGSAWIFIISPIAILIYPHLYSHMIHLNFIAGISLITFTISSHVILSHGKHLVDKEKVKLFFLYVFLIMLSVAIIRVLAIIFPSSYTLHLGIAAIFWCLSVALWIIKIGTKIWH